jgi:hypothetical protein
MTTPHHVTDLLLERYALDEVSPDERRAVETELERSRETRERLAALEASSREILEQYPVPQVVATIRTRHDQELPKPRGPRLAIWVPAAGIAAAALAATLLPGEPGDRPAPATAVEVTRAKGLVPTLFVHRQQESGSERLDDGARAAEHDLLQLSYVAAGRNQGAILSIDGRGAVTLHHPRRVGGDTGLLPAGEAALPHAYELDDAPDFERFFFVTAPLDTRSHLDVGAVMAAAKQLATHLERARIEPLPLPSGYEQTSVLLAKAERDQP